MKHSRLSTLLLLLAVGACARQGEGDTCLTSNGNGDCDSGLVCVAADKLAENNKMLSDYQANRCCPSDRTSSNSHCKLSDSTNIVSQTGGTGGTSTSAGGSGASSSNAQNSTVGGSSSSTDSSSAGNTSGGVGGTSSGGVGGTSSGT